MPIPNKSIIDSLTETIKQKVDPAKLYDILQKVNQNISKIYDTLFIGPLPPVSGEKLDLTALARTSLPPGIAFVDVSNTFSQNQTIKCDPRPELRLITTTGTRYGRLQQPSGTQTLVSNNLSYDGAAFQTDDGTGGSGFLFSGGLLQLLTYTGGVLYIPVTVSTDRIIRFGAPPTVTNAVPFDLVIPQGNAIRSPDTGNVSARPMIGMDANNLVQLGSKDAGAAFSTGCPAIPTPIAGELPAASAANNGMILIDKTNHRICWWDSGNRYFAAGTAF